MTRKQASPNSTDSNDSTDSSDDTVVQGSIREYVTALTASRRPGEQVVYHTVLDPRPAIYEKAAFAGSASKGGDSRRFLDQLLKSMEIDSLYCHQHEAISKIIDKKHVVVATPTASGKTLIYNLPVMDAAIRDPETRALYLFPLKALAQDQLRNFNAAASASPGHKPSAAIYDGDTTAWRRKKIRDNPPNVILTNPEMIHLGFLPHHDKWARFFSRLQFVVIDEVHVYRGVLGAHMAQVLRRLRRICAFYGADPVFIFCSATIANPAELAASLTGLDVECVDQTGAPEGRRHLVFINPVEGAARTAIMLLKAALARNLRTIVYSQSRKMTELIAMWASGTKGPYVDKISAYRAGFLPEERREIEHRLMSGELLAVIATSALELGIDVGTLDLCILVGYPGTVMATRQRGGRVGRSGKDSAVVMVGGEDALDQYILRHAEEFLSREPESAMVNPDNMEILSKHLVCAAAEHPLSIDDPVYNGFGARKCLDRLESSGSLLKSAEGTTFYAAEKSPQRKIDLRGSGSRFAIIDRQSGNHLGEIDGFRSFRETHPGAIYLHHGVTHRVEALSIETGTVTVTPANPNYYTRPRSNKQTEILDIYQEKSMGQTRVYFGRLKVTDQVTGYEMWQIRNHKRINILPLDLPPQVFETEGIWFEIPEHVQQAVENQQMHFMGGIHALEHAAIGLGPLFVLCDRNDLGGISMTYHAQVQSAAVFVYDACPGGIGLCRSMYEKADKLFDACCKTISDCECENGCPACVHSPKCGSGNRPLDKLSALFVLTRLLETPQQATMGAKGQVSRDFRLPSGIDRAKRAAEKETSPEPGRKHYGVLDIETRRSADEVGGWGKAHRMGISCAVLYDSGANDYFTYYQENAAALVEHLASLALVVGFNVKRFDYAVISGLIDFPFKRLPTLDILEEVHNHLGYRISLDHLARVTLGHAKSADGLIALEWWKQGKIDEIVAYCRKDVEITNDIYRFGEKNRYLLFKNKAGNAVRIPVKW